MTQKIVISTGGDFALSHRAVERFLELKGIIINIIDDSLRLWETTLKETGEKFDWDNYPINRTDPDLIQVVEELGSKCSRFDNDIKIVEVPDGVCWTLEERDEGGCEWIAEVHRTWR